jgi:pimeloyl-ACP methyl ester carboxylesterase
MKIVRRLTAWRLHSAHTHPIDVRRFMTLTATASRTGYLNRLRILRSWDVRAELSRIAADTLFLAADQDHLVPALEQARLMAAQVPRATVRVLEGHGHICLIAPDIDLARILDEWRPISA